MTIKSVTHLNFRGDARAALASYHSVFGGDQLVITYKDAGAVQNPAEADQVIWGQVAAENGFHVMAYDVPSATLWNSGEIPFFVSVRGDDAGEITRYWENCPKARPSCSRSGRRGSRRSTAWSGTALASLGSWTSRPATPRPDH